MSNITGRDRDNLDNISDFHNWQKGDLTVEKAEVNAEGTTVTAYLKDSKGNTIKVTSNDPRIVEYLSAKPGAQTEKAKEWFREVSATFSKKVGDVRNAEFEIVQEARGQKVVQFNVTKGGATSKGSATWEVSKNPIKALFKAAKETFKVMEAGGIGYDGNIQGYEKAGAGIPDKIRELEDPKGLNRINWKNVLFHPEETEARVAAVPLKNIAKMEDPSECFNNLIKAVGKDSELIAKLPWDELTPEQAVKLLNCLKPGEVGVKVLEKLVQVLKQKFPQGLQLNPDVQRNMEVFSNVKDNVEGWVNTGGPIDVLDGLYSQVDPTAVTLAKEAVSQYYTDPITDVAKQTFKDFCRDVFYLLNVGDKEFNFKDYRGIEVNPFTPELGEIFGQNNIEDIAKDTTRKDNLIRFGIFLKDLKVALGEEEYHKRVEELGVVSFAEFPMDAVEKLDREKRLNADDYLKTDLYFTPELAEIFPNPRALEKILVNPENIDNFIRFGLFLKDLKSELGEGEYNKWVKGILVSMSQSPQNGTLTSLKIKVGEFNNIRGEEAAMVCDFSGYRGEPIVVNLKKNDRGAVESLDVKGKATYSVDPEGEFAHLPSVEKSTQFIVKVDDASNQYNLEVGEQEVNILPK